LRFTIHEEVTEQTTKYLQHSLILVDDFSSCKTINRLMKPSTCKNATKVIPRKVFY
jgi:hypothetical protein